MAYKLYLDDDPINRNPPKDGGDWFRAFNVAEAIKIFLTNGWPAFVSFDHDLGEGQKTGFDFAKWLIMQDLDNADMPSNFTYTVHSMNPIGRENIIGLLESYLRFKNDL